MDRVEYASPILIQNEHLLVREFNVRLYDGNQKTNFEGGELLITSLRIIWARPGSIALGQTCLCIPLSLIVFVEEESPSAFSFSRSRKIILHLNETQHVRKEGPQSTSIYNFIKLSFREGFKSDIVGTLNKIHEIDLVACSGSTTSQKSILNIRLRTGIIGIERSLEEKQKETDKNISLAFQDLDKLMTMAKDMVRLSRSISSKIRDKQGDITEDETIRFKSYLLSLGIEDPVTREDYKSDNQYYTSLAKQICKILHDPISDAGGIMALADAYCRVNRARSLELISPQDLLNACKLMESLNLPLKLYNFESGVMVVQLRALNGEAIAESTSTILQEKGSTSIEELAQTLGISILLAKERLIITEAHGKSCRDDSSEGLRFYPNRLLGED